MKWAVTNTLNALNRHGQDLVYVTKTRTVDPIEATVTEVVSQYTLKIYPKPVSVNQYNFPTLVGKQVVNFYVAANGLVFSPKVSDTIIYQGVEYRINSFESHTAHGETILYKMLGVHG